jgi:hypothetical protein
MMLRFIPVFLTTLCLAIPAGAQVVVDQNAQTPFFPQPPDFLPQAPVGLVPNPALSALSVSQSITAGLSGRLDSVLFYGAQFATVPGTLQFSLYNGSYNSGSETLIGSRTLPIGAFADPIHPFLADFSGLNFSIAPGQIFSVLISSINPNPGTRLGFLGGVSRPNGPNPPIDLLPNYYKGGVAMSHGSANGVPFHIVRTNDLSFLSFVDITPLSNVPEPATWAMLILGFMLTGVAIRRSRGSFILPAF